MRRLLLATLLMGALTAGAQGLVTPRAKAAKQQAAIAAQKAGTRGEAEKLGRFFVNCKMDADARQVAENLRALGAKIRGVVGNIVMMEASYSKIEEMAAVNGVMKIDLGPRVRKQTDITRNVTQAGDVISGTGEKLPQAYTGKGVMVGIVDAGFDPTHPMLKDKDGNLRVKGYYATGLNKLGEEVIIGPDTLAGSALTKADDILDTLKVREDGDTHGTHCITIAAGSTISDVKGVAGQPLGGMAPEADILISTLREDDEFREFCSENQIDATAIEFYQALLYMKNEADKAKKPLVVSLSYNSMDGWHDGTSNMARTMKYCAKDLNIPIMLCTANSGGESMCTYLNMKTKAKDTLNVYAGYGGYVWGGMKTTKNVKFQVSIASGIDGHVYYTAPFSYNSDPDVGKHGEGIWFNVGEDADNSHLDDSDKKVADGMNEYIESGSAVQLWCYQNVALDKDDKEYTYTELYMAFPDLAFKKISNDRSSDGSEDFLVFKVSMITTEDTELYAWGDAGCEYYLYGQKNSGKITKGNSSISVGDWNTSGEVVSIGAWTANNKHKGLGDEEYTVRDDEVVGDYAFFSSYGKDLAGHKHPTVCTPGRDIVAGFNSFDATLSDDNILEKKEYSNQFKDQKSAREYPYGFSSGTSMATPAAAGIVALWLQAAADKGKTLSNADIKDIIKNTSDTDDYTKKSASRFGAGKMNAYKGLLYVLGIDTSIPTLSKEQPRDVSFRVNGDIVYTDGAEDGLEVTVYNLQGVAVRQTTVQGGAISLEGLPKGVYAVQLGKLGSTLIRK
ncbi:MAG: S8 family peptidase [Prevotella sp.]|nr:S8 family peptidase [Prevotella sp.]